MCACDGPCTWAPPPDAAGRCACRREAHRPKQRPSHSRGMHRKLLNTMIRSEPWLAAIVGQREVVELSGEHHQVASLHLHWHEPSLGHTLEAQFSYQRVGRCRRQGRGAAADTLGHAMRCSCMVAHRGPGCGLEQAITGGGAASPRAASLQPRVAPSDRAARRGVYEVGWDGPSHVWSGCSARGRKSICELRDSCDDQGMGMTRAWG